MKSIQKNMYLINRTTGLIHAYFREAEEPERAMVRPRAHLSGDFYVAKNPSLSIGDLRRINFVDTPRLGLSPEEYGRFAAYALKNPFTHIFSLDYSASTGKRILDVENRLEMEQDFSTDLIIEVHSFASLLIDRVQRTAEIPRTEVDRYGVIPQVNKAFVINGDNDQGIHDSPHLVKRLLN